MKMQNNIHYDYDNILSNYIHENYNNMETEEKKIILNKILKPDNINKLILSYSFYGLELEPKENITLTEFLSIADSLLLKYHHKADGFYLDDPLWSKHIKGGTYELNDNECIYENTVLMYLFDNGYVHNYLKKLLYHFNKIATNFSVIQKEIINEKERTVVIHYHVYDKNDENATYKNKKIIKKFI